MAKKIKVPLKMKNGALVRTLEELRENFDAESLAGYYESGKLLSWLTDRYYDVEAQKVASLDKEAKNLMPALCEALGIEVLAEDLAEIDREFLKRRLEKLEYLKTLTSDEMLLDRVDEIAITQEDLFTLLDLGKHTIYLCKGDFTVPVSVPNVTYIGIFEPSAVVRATDNVNFKMQNIRFKDMAFIWDVSGVSINDRAFQAERLFLEGKYEQSASLCRELVGEDNPRALMLLYRIYGSFLCNNKEARKYRNRGCELNEAYSLFDNNEWKFIGRYCEQLKKTAKAGTSFDRFYYGFALYKWGVYQGSGYSDEMIPAYLEAARQGNACACSSLGSRYLSGEGVPQDYEKAMEWYQKAAEQGVAYAAANIGVFYDNGFGVAQDHQKAMEWYQKARDNGLNLED